MIKNNWLKKYSYTGRRTKQQSYSSLNENIRYKWNRTINFCLEDKMHVAKTSNKVQIKQCNNALWGQVHFGVGPKLRKVLWGPALTCVTHFGVKFETTALWDR